MDVVIYYLSIVEVLKIDTSKTEKILISLTLNGEEKSLESSQTLGSQVLLEMIERILSENGVKKEDLDEIKVNIGQGSFTGLRVGVSVANALGFALKIPVNGKRLETEINY